MIELTSYTHIFLASHFLIISLLLLSAIFTVQSFSDELVQVQRSDFPPGFLFGTATSAYQIEGAVLEDGRSLSNWDAFSRINGSISNGENADIADDHYHRYMEDIEIMHSLGVDAYRFSISWSRLLPRGRFGGVNPAAIIFYNNIIDNLLSRGIEPFVTIYHNEFPQELEDRYGAWLNPLMQDDFVHFAKTCFENFADRVKYWVTINEPNIYAEWGYGIGTYPPGHCSPPFGRCSNGNSDVEPLIVVHNELLAHAKAAKLYREQFKKKRNGAIGMVIHVLGFKPLTDNEEDKEAVTRALAFGTAWILDPVVFGDYPSEMRRCLGSQLPKFSSDEMVLLRESIDFIGINHYGTAYAKDCIYSSCGCNELRCNEGADRPIKGFVCTTGYRNGVSIGEPTGIPGLFIFPSGMEDVVSFVKERYHNRPMFVTENGFSSPVSEEDNYLKDGKRISYHKSYLASLAQSIRNGADVRGYFVWSLMDNFEWASGYNTKFGMYGIDRATLNRIPKLSAGWYGDFLSNSSNIGLGSIAHHTFI